MTQFIFGLGSGRCGTGTLAELLDKQKGISCTHEGQFCPWEKDLIAFYQSICGLLKDATEIKIGNVAFYWKNYLSEIFRDFNNPKVIVLRREKSKVIESFGSMYRDKNHWSDPEGKYFDGRDPGLTPLGNMWPKYDLPKEQAIGQYWEDYYNDGAIEYWTGKFPQNIMLIRSEDLWAGEEAQKQIFDFLEIDELNRVYDTSIWSHKRQKIPPFIALDRTPPPELKDIGLYKALYGRQTMIEAGLPVDVEVQLSEDEFEQISSHPEMMRKLTNEAAENQA